MTTPREVAQWMELRREANAARLTRRDAQKLGLLVGAGGVLLGADGRPARAAIAYPASPATQPFVHALPVPQPLRPGPAFAPTGAHQHYARFAPQKHYQITASQYYHTFHRDLDSRGGQSPVWGFDGSVPGPTLDAHYGEPVLLRIHNDLPPLDDPNISFGMPDLITHLHNAHTASASDGGPWDWYAKGGFKDHHYTMARPGFTDTGTATIPDAMRGADGGDVRESQPSLFFHYHRPGFTAAGVYKGLVGFARFFDRTYDTGDETTGWHLPSGKYDIPLVCADKRFDAQGQLFFDQLNLEGFLGDKLTVNGVVQPYLEVEPRKYRLRLLNAGPSRFYTFVLRRGTSNMPFTQITHSGCFLQVPKRNLTRLEVQIAERNDIIVDFSGLAGQNVHLANILPMRSGQAPDRGTTLNPDSPANRLLEFRVRGVATQPNPPDFPTGFKFYDMPPLPANLASFPRRTWEIRQQGGVWTVNGRLWDELRDHAGGPLANPVRRGGAEVWVLRNAGTTWEHPAHIHFEEAIVLKVNGVALTPAQRYRTDVYRLGRNTTIEALLRFRDFPVDGAGPLGGRYVMHCHNTVHEDHAMMATWNVVP
jgi:FtsP/CotA-like multicopper oxidase with cupredoxin domain